MTEETISFGLGYISEPGRLDQTAESSVIFSQQQQRQQDASIESNDRPMAMDHPRFVLASDHHHNQQSNPTETQQAQATQQANGCVSPSQVNEDNADMESQVTQGRNRAMEIAQRFRTILIPQVLQPVGPGGYLNLIPPISPDIKQSAEEGRAKAISIAYNFQQPQTIPVISTHIVKTELDYIRGREESLARLEKRKHAALLKNYAYVASKEKRKMEAQIARVQQMKEAETEGKKQYDDLMEQRMARRRGQPAKQGTNKKQKLQSHKDRSIAIYVAGLPKDGSVSDELMVSLFGAYGRIQRIHFYRDRVDGTLKGDALVIYAGLDTGSSNGTDGDNDQNGFIETICSQYSNPRNKMNEAELPCGTVIKVQAAAGANASCKVTHEQESKSETIASNNVESEGTTAEQVISGGEEDLDDFFTSLE